MRLFRRRRPQSARDLLLQGMPPGSVCAEIGVHLGDFSQEILRVVRPRRLHLIDPWRLEEGEPYKQAWYGREKAGSQETMDARHAGVVARFRREVDAGQVVVHRAESAVAAAEFPDEYFDWVYIDGNHLYEFARQDLALYHPKVKTGGAIAGDDYGQGGWWEGGVQRAVDEFVGAGHGTVVSIREGQFVLRRTP